MPRRRRLLIVAAAALLLVVAYIHWAWDPVDVTRYVPPDSIIVLEMEDLAGGLSNVGYRKTVGALPEPMRRNALLPYRSLGPGISAMDIIGTRCVIFVPQCAAGTMPHGAVLAVRISQKTKIAETVASLLGKTLKKKTQSGRTVRMVQTTRSAPPLFYARIDRIVLASDSLDSLDAALSTPPAAAPVTRAGRPTVTLRIEKEGFTAILELLRSHRQYLQIPYVGYLVDEMNNLMEMEVNISLSEKPEFTGHLAYYMGGLFEKRYREVYAAYEPRGFDVIPGRLLMALSTNDAGLAEELDIASFGVNRVFHEVNDFFQDLGTHDDDDVEAFSGELTIAATRVGEETAGFLFVSTRKIFFPKTIINGLLHRIRAKIGETTYFGREKDGEVYRVRLTATDVPVYLWIAGNTIVLCSSENAFLAFVAKPSADPGGLPTFGKGDFFLAADPPADPEAFITMLPMWDDRYRFLLDTIGPVRLQATSSGGKIGFSGHIAVRHDEDS